MSKKGGSEKTLWDIAVEERIKEEVGYKDKGKEDTSDQPTESCILVCGSKQSGKSSMILRFLERDENPKPTVALDYTFARRPRGHKMIKDVCNIYELGGGASMSRLIETIITSSSISSKNLSIVVVLDLSRPNDLWETQEILLKEVKHLVKKALSEIDRSAPSTSAKMKQKCWERVGENHADKNLLDPLQIPLLIIGNKYDKYQEMEPEKKKIISKTLRFIAHKNGASLQFSSNKIDNLSSKTRSLFANMAFNMSVGKSSVTDHNKPIIVHAGQDKFDDIGAPSISADRMMRVKGGTPDDLWRESFSEVFPPQNSEKEELKNDPSKDRQYAEQNIDAIKAQKDQELANCRKQSERKAKEAGAGSSRASKSEQKRKAR
ncbi:cytoplasmic dynein 2 light intermediate chain 1-like [Rhopilema esculentum]|uniref:cytoplasmic dynein 2 light intermediate chain 1-like n=1 Tax=Rhopilema esculentum TaxID=499914 RepID=UPI0031D895F4